MDPSEADRPAHPIGSPAARRPSEPADGTVGDSRAAVAYLTWPESDDYLAIMDVLETSVTDLTAGEVGAALIATGRRLPVHIVESRLESLHGCGAVSVRADTSRARRFSELLARNWRYTASPVGRQVQRFYRSYLSSTPTVREIPIQSLNLLVTSLESMAALLTTADDASAAAASQMEAATIIFTNHESLDSALVGAEDILIGLADRFDLDGDRTSELKTVLVEYAKRIADELDSGSARAAVALGTLAPHFGLLADAMVATSQASALIAVGALSAVRGGRAQDWSSLRDWCDPATGRAARFSRRLVHALPSMHANLRRLHSSSGTATNRSRALSLARAIVDSEHGTQIFQAALGDHSWRKLYGIAEDSDVGRNPSWRGGPEVPVPALLRHTGRSGARGRGAVPRNDAAARAEVEGARRRRQDQHAEAVGEVLASEPGQILSGSAARAALDAMMAAARTNGRGSVRTASASGLACTLARVEAGEGLLAAENWRVILPGRIPLFHLPGRRPNPAQLNNVGVLARHDDAVAVPIAVTLLSDPEARHRPDTHAQEGAA